MVDQIFRHYNWCGRYFSSLDKFKLAITQGIFCGDFVIVYFHIASECVVMLSSFLSIIRFSGMNLQLFQDLIGFHHGK